MKEEEEEERRKEEEAAAALPFRFVIAERSLLSPDKPLDEFESDTIFQTRERSRSPLADGI